MSETVIHWDFRLDWNHWVIGVIVIMSGWFTIYIGPLSWSRSVLIKHVQ